MITRKLQFEIVNRIRSARHARCGGDAWVPPPARWAIIVRESWPEIWSQDPSRVGDGWCDLLMAFSSHAIELGGSGMMHDVAENSLSGRLHIERFYDDDRSARMLQAVQGYQQASQTICRQCGDVGMAYQVNRTEKQVLCKIHSGWRGQ